MSFSATRWTGVKRREEGNNKYGGNPVFLKDEKQVPVILNALNSFSNASGLSQSQ